MSFERYSVAMPENVAAKARQHLLRPDQQEDLCFGLWRPSTGSRRFTAIVTDILLPEAGERNVHGNVSFEPHFLERSLSRAAAAGAGLCLMHSHPRGRAWQDMSRDDISTERGIAGSVYGATGMPFLGLTIAGQDAAWSARFWKRTAPRQYERMDCESVRLVGDHFKITYCERLLPVPRNTAAQIRTVNAWGEKQQADLIRLRIGVVGAGSVGSFVGEALARSGFKNVSLIDFDKIEEKNLDRLLYATRADIGKLKVDVFADRLRLVATAERFSVLPIPKAVYDWKGLEAALDCDFLISCVDRPWGRHILNLVSYAHLIPVVDGGIAVGKNRKDELVRADWRAHVATPGRKCLHCLGQYNLAHVQTEREGHLDDPRYIDGLPKDHVLRSRENVFVFSQACASLQILQMLNMIIAPHGRSNPGAQIYHFAGGFMEEADFTACNADCPFPTFIGQGDSCAFLRAAVKPQETNS